MSQFISTLMLELKREDDGIKIFNVRLQFPVFNACHYLTHSFLNFVIIASL